MEGLRSGWHPGAGMSPKTQGTDRPGKPAQQSRPTDTAQLPPGLERRGTRLHPKIPALFLLPAVALVERAHWSMFSLPEPLGYNKNIVLLS